METENTDKRLWTWVSEDGKSASAGMSLGPGGHTKIGAGHKPQPYDEHGRYGTGGGGSGSRPATGDGRNLAGKLYAADKLRTSDAPNRATTPKDYSPVPGHDDGGEAFYKALRFREASDNTATNAAGSHIGLYQLGDYERRQIGAQDGQGNWTGKYGRSEQEFLASRELQDKAVREWHGKVWQEIQQKGLDRYEGQVIDGVEVTRSGMTSAAHLKGVDELGSYLKSHGRIDGQDRLHTPISTYMKDLGGYPVPYGRRR